MARKAKIIATCFFVLLALMVFPHNLQAAPTTTQIAEIAGFMIRGNQAEGECRVAMAEAERAGRAGNTGEQDRQKKIAKAAWQLMISLRQQAIDLADKYYKTNVKGRPTYDPYSNGCGETDPAGNVSIGNAAFHSPNPESPVSPGWLASAKAHEGVHQKQFADGLARNGDYWTPCTKLNHRIEHDAYQEELRLYDEGETGLNVDEWRSIQSMHDYHAVRMAAAFNHLPTLEEGGVKPLSGNVTTAFAFTIEWTDRDNDPPEYVWVFVDDQRYTASQVDPYDVNYTDGTTFELDYITLPAGSHYYHFEASDGVSHARFPTTGETSGPSVTLPSPPPAPILKLPTNMSMALSLTLRLEWNASTGAISYGLQVATDPTFTNLVLSVSGITDLYYDVPSRVLNWNTPYYWRVNATNASGTSGWSDYWHFKTAAGP
jgi:hypothetical protein